MPPRAFQHKAVAMRAKKIRYVIPAVLALVAAVLFAAALLCKGTMDEALATLPHDAIAIGVHSGVRSNWKKQLRSPVVSHILAAYGVEARDIIGDPGVYWTMRLAIADELVSAATLKNGEYVIAAASPAHMREPLLRLFLALNWVPGLGRLERAKEGFRYTNVASKHAPAPLYLSLAMRGNILMARLGANPEGFPERHESPRLAAQVPPVEAGHAFAVQRAFLQDAFFPIAGDDATLTLHVGEDTITANIGASLDEISGTGLARLAKRKLAGGNSTVSALAGDHAIAMLLLPAEYVSPLVVDFLHCGKGESSKEDAALYLTSGEFGAKLFAFDIPAATACVPGIAIDSKGFLSATKAYIPKIMRGMFTIHNEFTVCSSLSSLEEQKHSPKATGKTWKDAYAEIADNSPCAFLYADTDPLVSELKKVVSAIQMVKSFGVLKMEKDDSDALATVANALPRFPTGTSISAALFSIPTSPSFTLRLVISQK